MFPLFPRLLLLISVAEGVPKKLAEEGIAERILATLVFHYLGSRDVYYRRKQWFDHRRKSLTQIHRTRRRIAGDAQCDRTAGAENWVPTRVDHPSQRPANHQSRGQGDQRYGTSNLKKSIVHDQWPPAT